MSEPVRALLVASTVDQARRVAERWRIVCPELRKALVLTPLSMRSADGYRATVVYVAPGLTTVGSTSHRLRVRRALRLADRLLRHSQEPMVFHLLPEDSTAPIAVESTAEVLARVVSQEESG